jgi:DNA polymerase-3 subunit delta'
VPIVPLFGHEALRARLVGAACRGELAGSVLLHGPAGVGKQRLALEVARALLCSGAEPPCGACQGCRFAGDLTHPDLHWYFPRPRLKDGDAGPAEVESDFAEAVAERAAANGLYARPPGTSGLYLPTVVAMLRQASMTPALGRRKVFVVGDAERMVSQEGADQAANAFLKLLEEPPADTTLLLTSSEPGALLPTIRSRVVAVRVAALPEHDVRRFLEDEVVRARLDAADGMPRAPEERLRLAAGRPGRLLDRGDDEAAALTARRLLEAAESGSRARWLRAAAGLGVAKARGGFADALDALTPLLHDRVRLAVQRGDEPRAVRLGRAMMAVEAAKDRSRGNVNPQLTGAALLRELAAALR